MQVKATNRYRMGGDVHMAEEGRSTFELGTEYAEGVVYFNIPEEGREGLAVAILRGEIQDLALYLTEQEVGEIFRPYGDLEWWEEGYPMTVGEMLEDSFTIAGAYSDGMEGLSQKFMHDE